MEDPIYTHLRAKKHHDAHRWEHSNKDRERESDWWTQGTEAIVCHQAGTKPTILDWLQQQQQDPQVDDIHRVGNSQFMCNNSNKIPQFRESWNPNTHSKYFPPMLYTNGDDEWSIVRQQLWLNQAQSEASPNHQYISAIITLWKQTTYFTKESCKAWAIHTHCAILE